MPSHAALPSLGQYLDAYAAEIQVNRRSSADVRRGSGLDVFGGTSALLFARQAAHDRDLFRAVFFDTATGDELDTLIERRFNEPRVASGHGTGNGVFSRASAAAGAGTFWEGTRVAIIPNGNGQLRWLEVASDTDCGALALTANVPLRTLEEGATRPIDIVPGDAIVRFEDPLWDDSWVSSSITVGSGSDRELDPDYRARVKALRQSRRTGYAKAITDACVAAGAAQVALFPSNWTGTDTYLNRCYVGDSSYQTTQELRVACLVALDRARVLGADMLVLGMTPTRVSVGVSVRLWNSPSGQNRNVMRDAVRGAVVDYFNTRANAFYFTEPAIRGAVLKALRTDVQSVVVTTDPLEPTVATLFNAAPLPRYFTIPSAVTVDVSGPV